MPLLLTNIPFDASRATVARRPFLANGRRYKPGSDFPWRRLAIDVSKVKRMYDNNFLMHVEPVNAPIDLPQPANAPDRVIDYNHEPIREPADVVESVTNPDIKPDIKPDGDDLDAIEDMKALRDIADEIGAPYKVSKTQQRKAIREARKASSE